MNVECEMDIYIFKQKKSAKSCVVKLKKRIKNTVCCHKKNIYIYIYIYK